MLKYDRSAILGISFRRQKRGENEEKILAKRCAFRGYCDEAGRNFGQGRPLE
jgi:hypothetical protein